MRCPRARRRAGNPAAHTELACNILCGTTAEEAARVTDDALPTDHTDTDASQPLYEQWRRDIRRRLGARREVAA